jgi:hypothetical protein
VKNTTNLPLHLPVHLPVHLPLRGLVTIVLCCGLVFSGYANVGGGLGLPKSPYIHDDVADDLEHVSAFRRDDAKGRSVSFTASNVTVTGDEIGMTYAGPDTPLDKPQSEISGVSNPGNVITAVEFGVIDKMIVAQKDRDTITLKLTVFPDIAPSDLVRLRPSYLELAKKYRKEVTLQVPLRSKDGLPFVLTGKALDTEPRKIICLFKDVPEAKEIKLLNPNYWWAIKSVTDDPAYPNRVVTKN